MSEAVNIAESEVIPFAKRLKIIIWCGGIHWLAVPLSEKAIVLYPLVA